MIQSVPTQIRIDKNVKDKSTKLFKKLGLDMSSAVNIFLNQCIINDGLPFIISNKKNTRLEQTIEEARKIHSSKNVKVFRNVDDLFKDMGYES